MKRFVLGLAVCAAAVGAAHAAGSPFAGHWKLDTAKSQFTGDTMSYTKTATGYEFSNGGTIHYAFAVDGKDHPMIAGRTTVWTKAGDHAWDVAYKAGDKVLSKGHRVLSPDGKTLTTTYVDYNPDGTVSHEKDVYQRTSGAGGLEGKWKDVKVEAANDEMTIAAPAAGSMRLEDPTQKVVVVAKLDGSPATLAGPTVPPGAAATYKADGPNRWAYAQTLGGKPFSQGVMSVSADGKTLTDTSWRPGKEAEKSTAVYMRQ